MNRTQAAISVIVILVVVAVAVVLYQGYYGPGQPAPQPGENQVNIQDFAYAPESVTVSVGTTITWTNHDSVDHTVTTSSGPESFDSGNISPGDTFQYTFNTAGTYEYYCTIHPYMSGTVIVQEAGGN
jgi:plastocyanin